MLQPLPSNFINSEDKKVLKTYRFKIRTVPPQSSELTAHLKLNERSLLNYFTSRTFISYKRIFSFYSVFLVASFYGSLSERDPTADASVKNVPMTRNQILNRCSCVSHTDTPCLHGSVWRRRRCLFSWSDISNTELQPNLTFGSETTTLKIFITCTFIYKLLAV